MHSVNPPGFDIDNAMSVEDVGFQVTNLAKRANKAAIKAWGPMLIADRNASLSDYRDGLNQYARSGTIADNVALDIEYAIEHGFDSQPNRMY